MKYNNILTIVDHTLLAQSSTWEQIKELCDDAMKYKTASVCIPPYYVNQAKEYVKENMAVCTVIGFPNGNVTTKVKIFETKNAIDNGADEIDMVINIGMLKDKKYDEILDEINQIKKACSGKLLKVIIETCLLNDEEIIKMCQIVSNSEADYIKTSTGFSTAGATFKSIELMKNNMTNDKKIKAAGGIKSIDDALKFMELGADRLGTSRIVKIVKSM